MSNTISRSDILESIAEMDMNDLREVIDIVNTRKRHLAERAARNFSVGDKVRTSKLRKTNEWAGVHEGVITKVNRKTANVTFPHPIHGYDAKWKVYMTSLEKIED